ncbi:unnamed protein product, partial [Ascophyllum nodosum]
DSGGSCTGLASTIGATTGSSCGCSIKSRSEEKERDGEGRQGIPEHLERLHPRPGRQTVTRSCPGHGRMDPSKLCRASPFRHLLQRRSSSSASTARRRSKTSKGTRCTGECDTREQTRTKGRGS